VDVQFENGNGSNATMSDSSPGQIDRLITRMILMGFILAFVGYMWALIALRQEFVVWPVALATVGVVLCVAGIATRIWLEARSEDTSVPHTDVDRSHA
jgi:hypothetical protein